MFSKPPPPPASSPELDESALITAVVLVVLTFAALLFSKMAAMPPLKTPKELAAAKALRSKLSDPALLVEFGDADYEAVRTGATWDPKLLKPRKKGDNAARVWSSATHGTETWNMDAAGVPSAICRCATVADVQAVVKHAAAIQLQHTLPHLLQERKRAPPYTAFLAGTDRGAEADHVRFQLALPCRLEEPQGSLPRQGPCEFGD